VALRPNRQGRRLGRGRRGSCEQAHALDHGLTHRVHHPLADPLLFGGREGQDLARALDLLERVVGGRVFLEVTQHEPDIVRAPAPGGDQDLDEVQGVLLGHGLGLDALLCRLEHRQGSSTLASGHQVLRGGYRLTQVPFEPEGALAVTPALG